MSLTLFGGEFVVSTIVPSTTQYDFAGAATGLANGGFALTYVAGSSYDYVTQVYNGLGTSTAGPTDLGNGNINGGVSYKDGGIAELSTGWLVKSYSKIGPGPSDPIDVGILRFQQDLTGASGPVTPGPEAPSYQPGYQYHSTLASSPLGGYVVVWDDYTNSYGRPGANVIVQAFADSGVASGSAFVASEAAFSGGNQVDPDVARLGNGGYVVTWQDDSGLDGSGSGIRARVFTSTGAVATGEKSINQGTSGNQTAPVVTGLVGGGFVVAWEDAGKIKARTFGATGTAVSGDITVSKIAGGYKSDPDVTALSDGGFVVTWTTDATTAANGGDGSGTAVKARAFSSTGAASGDEILVNSVTNGDQHGSIATTLADGRVVVTWTDGSNVLNSGVETRAQILDPRTVGVTVNGTSGPDKYVGSAFADTLNGGGGSDDLRGNGGNDVLNGGAGGDLLRGGAGNDTYVVDNSGDVVDESYAGSSGVDTVRSSISLSLSDAVHIKGGVENLTLLGAANLNATGNTLANILTGNVGNNLLDGKAGADTMRGLAGNDTYIVDNAGDVADETGGSGTDLVKSSISFSLSDTVHAKGTIEKLILTGTFDISATGNGLANTLVGNAGANKLNGGDGGDTLSGGLGTDKLLGKGGKDIFVFADAIGGGNVDTIKGYKHKQDRIFLDQDIFAAVGPKLDKSEFFVGKRAHDGDDHVVRSGSNIFYDVDGKGGTKQVLFAKISKNADLDHKDFMVGDFVI